MPNQEQLQDVYQRPQSVGPERPLEPTLTVEGYEPPPTQPANKDAPAEPLPPAPPPPPGPPVRKLLTLFLGIIALLVIGFLIFRFLGSGEESGPVVLNYWGLWESEEVMQTVISDYQRKHPNVKINYTMQSPIEYRERLQASLARGEGPEIFRIHNTWLPMLRNDLAALPKNVMEAKEFQETFYPVAQKDLLSNNKFYGIPLMIDGLLLYYNKDLLSSAGLSVPSTWREFEEAVASLTVKDQSGRIVTAGAAIGTAGNIEHFSDVLGLILYQNGTDPGDLTSQAAEQALTYYTLFAQKPNNVWDSFQDNSILAFAAGKVGFIFAPSWQVFTIQALNPNLNFGVSAVPQLEGGTPVSWASYWVEGVSSRLKNTAAAFEFLKYLSSQEVMNKLFSEQAKMRAFGEAYSRVDLADQLVSHEFLGPVISQAGQMRSWYLASRTFDNGINDKIIKYLEDAVNSVNQGGSPRGALETASQGVKQVLSEYGVSQ